MREKTLARGEAVQIAKILENLADAYRKAKQNDHAEGISEAAKILDDFARNNHPIEQLLVDVAKNAPKA